MGNCCETTQLSSKKRKESCRSISEFLEVIDKDGFKTSHYLSQNTADTSEETHEDLSKYEVHKLIGRGSYAKVFLVSRTNTGEKYAMKVLRKCEMECKRDVKRVFIEKDIIRHLDHPFIVKLYSTFQTKDKAYFIMDLLNGGDLYAHITQFGKFKESKARFYAAEIILALEHLHKNKIIYRDLKPQNIVIDSDGHIKLADFGLAKTNFKQDQENTICGTMKYIAPETIGGGKYTFTIDWWSLGIIIYRMLTGQLPHPTSANSKIPKYIINHKLPFKKELLTKNAYNLVTKLCERDPELRLGALGVDEIKEHPFFKNINWTKLYKKEVKPPYKPRKGVVTCGDLRGGLEDTKIKRSQKKGKNFHKEHFVNFSFASPELRGNYISEFDDFEESKY
ncbi:unnamed protein product [Moneuplotes crassus]|uniref:Uncharacterized protein n=1 Tax=Euplotes crassus TaxID=5936 RepID=A0AAD1X982_EUPCR|nr:unnamed protein product [Moneuplotes crassus]